MADEKTRATYLAEIRALLNEARPKVIEAARLTTEALAVAHNESVAKVETERLGQLADVLARLNEIVDGTIAHRGNARMVSAGRGA